MIKKKSLCILSGHHHSLGASRFILFILLFQAVVQFLGRCSLTSQYKTYKDNWGAQKRKKIDQHCIGCKALQSYYFAVFYWAYYIIKYDRFTFTAKNRYYFQVFQSLLSASFG
jgi:hypothetical protein